MNNKVSKFDFEDVINNLLVTGKRYGHGRIDIEEAKAIFSDIMAEVHNNAIQLAADNAELKSEEPHFFSHCQCRDYSLDKDSILNLKNIL